MKPEELEATRQQFMQGKISAAEYWHAYSQYYSQFKQQKKMKELNETADMMCSTNYKERFKAEYYQLKIRFIKLKAMVCKWDDDNFDFTPTCPRATYDLQLRAMSDYLAILETRAAIEGIEL